MVVKSKEGLPVSIGILILLLALIVYKNRRFNFSENKKRLLAVALAGVALTIIKVEVAFVYAIIGLFLLTMTQLKVLIKGKPIWYLTGGNPLHKLDEDESKLAGLGLSMMLSVALAFFVKVLWLSNAI